MIQWRTGEKRLTCVIVKCGHSLSPGSSTALMVSTGGRGWGSAAAASTTHSTSSDQKAASSPEWVGSLVRGTLWVIVGQKQIRRMC